jgi:hypothetical protein
MISIQWLIFGIFTTAFVVGMIIHLAKEHYSGGGWFSSHKSRGELGSWGLLQIIGYLIFLAIYGGIYWW